MKTLGLAIVLGIVAGTVAACANNPGASTEVVVTAADSGDRVKVPESGIIELRLGSNPSTGYGWEITEIDRDKLEQIGAPRFEDRSHGSDSRSGADKKSGETGLVGAPKVEVWRFKALQKSESKLALEYKRPWETDEPAAETFEVTVLISAGEAEVIPLHPAETESPGGDGH